MSGKLKRTRGSGNVFADLGFAKAEAENLKLRAELMMCIEDYYRRSGMTQSQAAIGGMQQQCVQLSLVVVREHEVEIGDCGMRNNSLRPVLVAGQELIDAAGGLLGQGKIA